MQITLADPAELVCRRALQLIAVSLPCLALSCVEAQQTVPAGALTSSLRLELSVDQSRSADPVVTIKFINQGARPVGVTKTFGLQDAYLTLEIEQDGTPVEYPHGSQYELFGNPGYTCLRPHASTSLTLRLNHGTHYR